MITGVERISSGFDFVFNKYIIHKLYTYRAWSLSYDDLLGEEDGVYEKSSELYSDSGFVISSFDINQHYSLNERYHELNIYADLILHTILQKQNKYNFKNVRPTRFLWNYYNKGSSGLYHIDTDSNNSCSIVYYLNDCDAHTIIDGKYYDCVMGDGVLFDSNIIHKGTGPASSRCKFALNLIFSYSDLITI